ncbi:MAG: OmpA family protein [Tannerellaceae bacterium]|nr:OmpA family protein [Tannerellaceae bacterium]
MKRAYIYIIFIFSAAILYSCKTAKLSTAEEKHRIGEYFEAAAIYKKVYAKTSPKDRFTRGYIAYRMGECNRIINNVARAFSDYSGALRYQYPDSSVTFWLGQVSQKRGQYAEAIKYYNEYLKSSPGDEMALKGIRGCEQALEWKKNPSRYIVRRMEKFNSRYAEFAPMLYGENYDQLYFTSSRQKDRNGKVSGITGLSTNNFFLAKQDEKGVWQAPVEIDDAVNTAADEGTPSFTSDGGTMFYTYCADDESGARTAEIYTSARSSASWEKGSRISLIKDSVTTIAHPSVSPDGKYLYFVSDGLGGYGGKDIFRARIVGNDFGPVENLGDRINTPGDELFPYVRDSARLYFASDGHPGMGGLDLFEAVQDGSGSWEVTNMKPPVNSMADDFGITFAGSAEHGFFSSNRGDARGYDHIYSFELPSYVISIEGIVSDIDENPLEGAVIRIVGYDGMNEKVVAKKNGSYRIELQRDISYVMMASARGFLNQNFELKTNPEEKNETYTVDFFLSPVYRPVVIDNIFYDYDKATLRTESRAALDELVKMLNDNPNVTIELGAHTDRKGSEAYNRNLAQRRAQSVVDYLVESGISISRMEAKGYGKSVPKEVDRKTAAQYNFLNEGDVLTEEFVSSLPPALQDIADQINRRTEFKVLRTNYNMY